MVSGKKPQKEEWGLVLDFLPYGSPEDNRPVYQKKPLVQAVGESYRVYIGEGDRNVIDHVKRRITYDELTHGSQMELPFILENIILENESKYIDFFNDAYPITNRLHMLELLPGIGKKLMWAIIDEHKKGKFLNFNNLVERVKGLHTPEKLIVHRIIDELMDENIKYRLFTTPAKSRHHK